MAQPRKKEFLPREDESTLSGDGPRAREKEKRGGRERKRSGKEEKLSGQGEGEKKLR